MANYGYKGWIKLWRAEIKDNPLYKFEGKPFDMWHAWIDLCMIAEDEETVKTSLEALKTRWFWGSTKKVRKYLETVRETGLATVTFIPKKGTEIRINKGFFVPQVNPKKRRKETVKETVKETEEVLHKEVGDATSLKSRRTPYNNQEKYTELLGELDNEYE